MGRPHRLLVILLGALAALVLVVGGLSALLLVTGGDDDDGGGVTRDGGGGDDDRDAAGRLRLAGGDPVTLDPARASDATSAEYIAEVFSGLVTLTPDLEVALDLAQSVEVSDDGTVYTFVLRDDIFFHSGRRVTAEDVRWSIERAAAPETLSTTAPAYLGDIVGFREYFFGLADELTGVRVLDERTVAITIDAPKTYFLAKLAYPTAFVVDRQTVESNPRNWERNPNGTGPYRLREWRLGERIVLEAAPNHHLGAPAIRGVVYQLSGGSALTRFENGELDVAPVSVSDVDRARDPNSDLSARYQVYPQLTVSFIAFNVDVPPFDDPLVRRALAQAIDRQKVAEVTFKGMLAPATGIIPGAVGDPDFRQLPGFTANDKTLPYDPDAARAALAASGYGSAEALPPIVMTEVGGGAEGQIDTQAFIEQWRTELGIEVTVDQTDFASYLADADAGRLQMFNGGWIMDYPDPENILDLKFHSGSPLNDINYHNARVDSLLESARTEEDTAARIALYQEVEELIIDDVAWIPLYFSRAHTVVAPRVAGWFEPAIVVPRLRHVSLSE